MKAIKKGLDRINVSQALTTGALPKWRDHLVNAERQLRRINRPDTEFIADTIIAVATEISLEITEQTEAKNEANRN